jgi:hypothetical protein
MHQQMKQAESEELFLARRFEREDCLHCGRGAAGHTAPVDRYGDRALRCNADDELWGPAAERAYFRRQSGWLP